MRGVFFVPPSIFKPPSSSAGSFPKSARKNSASFLKNSPCFYRKQGRFCQQFPTFPPRPQPSISSHAFRLARFPFVLSASPFFCQNAAICAKTPLIYHILSEKDEAKQDILQTFFIFASETYATIVVLLAAHLSSLCNRGIFPNELECSVESPPHSQPAPASSMGVMCVSVISRNKKFSCNCPPCLPSIRRQTILIRSFYPPFPPFTARR